MHINIYTVKLVDRATKKVEWEREFPEKCTSEELFFNSKIRKLCKVKKWLILLTDNKVDEENDIHENAIWYDWFIIYQRFYHT